MTFTVHTAASAPEASRATIGQFVQAWGFLPNLGGVLAQSPAALELLWQAYGAMTSAKATLSPTEQQVVAIAASRVNRCSYCVAAHSTLAVGAGMEVATLQAVRDGRPIADTRLEALRQLTERLVRQRGLLSLSEKDAFFSAGYTSGQLLEVIGWVTLKTLTNYVNHVTETPVDAQWQGQRWAPND